MSKEGKTVKSVLISRYGAYGDILHMSHLPRMLKEECGFDYVAVDTNFKGYQILSLNPFIDKFYFFDKEITNNAVLQKRWEVLGSRYDHFINLYHTLEYDCIAMEDQSMYYMHDDVRRAFGKGNFYDRSTVCAGYPQLAGNHKADIFFSEAEIDVVDRNMRKHDGKFKVMLNLSGSGPHKRLVVAQELVKQIRKLPDSLIITTGDVTCTEADELIKPDISLIKLGAPINQAMATLKHVDCCIGHESGIMIASNAMEVPTIQLMTSSSLENHPNYCHNDYSMQSPANCSPCHKGPYKYIGCHKIDNMPECIFFNVSEIMENVNEIYKIWKS